MNTQAKIEMAADPARLRLHKEGTFYKLYNQHAMLFTTKSNFPVAPLEKLSKNHLTMARMISNGSLYFINDEKWRKENLAKKIKLPLFVEVRGDAD